MKLGKLLAAGKSIMNGRAEVSYRASKQVYLPKFGSAKNPFKNETTAAVPEEAAILNSAIESPMAAPAPRPTRAETIETAVAMPMHDVAAIAQELPPLPAMSEKKKTSWAGKLNPASIFRHIPGKGELKALDGQKTTATQAELSLDTVKVVHNDLSDAEVEVVPMKSRSAPQETPPAKGSWEALGEQLFGVKTT
ncbi:MAG TPA: hypothetical protein VK811_10035 [Candidatus Acidoferrum sp.]|jgi:hypothetical protein|nr:hypothetical protein [Candidatus Acidoferrum sp.]